MTVVAAASVVVVVCCAGQVVARRLIRGSRPGGGPGSRSVASRRRTDGLADRLTSVRFGAAARRRRQRDRPDTAAVATWCDDLAIRLRSGATVHSALATTTPTHAVLAEHTEPLRRALRRGRPVAVAAAELADRPRRGRRPSEHTEHAVSSLMLVATVLATAAEAGGPIAPPLERTATALRLRWADEQERAANTAQARLSAVVMSLVPVGALAFLVATDGEVRATSTTPLGGLLVAGGLGLNGLGWWWMRRVIGAGT